MRVFRKRKKFGNFGGSARDAEPLPDIVYQMGAEQAARLVALQARSGSPFAGMHDPHMPYIVPDDEVEYYDEPRASSPLQFIANALGVGRSRSSRRFADGGMEHFSRPGSPAHFASAPGTPIKYRRRAHSPEIVRSRPASPMHFVPAERVPSPLHFAAHPRAASPDVARRMRRAQLSQELQQAERMQRQQHDAMMLGYPVQYPAMQTGYYPMVNPLIQQPQMYAYY